MNTTQKTRPFGVTAQLYSQQTTHGLIYLSLVLSEREHVHVP